MARLLYLIFRILLETDHTMKQGTIRLCTIYSSLSSKDLHVSILRKDSKEQNMSELYRASVTVKGGRDGRAISSDGRLDVSLSMPRELGGVGAVGATNPEQLFAAGYAACFESAIRHVARERKLPLKDASVQADVALNSEDGSFKLAVVLKAELSGLSFEDAKAVVHHVHEAVCPYSKAVRGNVDVAVTVIAEEQTEALDA
jgi:osmotically inducible protein OsmC